MIQHAKLEFLKARLNLDGVGLELGPNVNPMFRKSKGFQVKYLETRSGDELRETMVKSNRNPELVEDIDFVLDRTLTLSENVDGEVFDWVASSHVLEHIPDFVGHLNEVHSVLHDGGVYAAIVPDRNLCFDCLKSPSSLGDILQAHIEKRQVPSIASNIDELRYGVRPEGVKIGGWTPEKADGKLIPKFPEWADRVRNILKVAETGTDDRPDHLVGHSWRFDPVSFAQILADLGRLELVGLQLIELRPTYNMDFIAILKKVPRVDPEAITAIGREIAADYIPPVYLPENQP